VRAFVDEYSATRSTPMSRKERAQVAGCAMFIAAYTARWEHRGPVDYDPATDTNSFIWALRTHGVDYLRP
jgi:hypothetical protein